MFLSGDSHLLLSRNLNARIWNILIASKNIFHFSGLGCPAFCSAWRFCFVQCSMHWTSVCRRSWDRPLRNYSCNEGRKQDWADRDLEWGTVLYCILVLRLELGYPSLESILESPGQGLCTSTLFRLQEQAAIKKWLKPWERCLSIHGHLVCWISALSSQHPLSLGRMGVTSY